MTGREACVKCERTAVSVKLMHCNKAQKPMCRDCCVKTSGGIDKCDSWKVCWFTHYL